jgi:hypothetical protein
MSRFLLVVILAVLAGCAEPPPSSGEGDVLARANAVADDLAQTLRARLLSAMREGGPASAVRVCADEAQAIARAVEQRHGARVGRSSLRLRNPEDAPPPWVATWLAEQGERSAEGVTGFARAEGGGARVLRPIAIEGPCLACHGPPGSIAPEVAAILRQRYPSDAATGYALGDLRGALWAEVP